MTETEWLTCTDPQRMLEFLRDKASDRKLRLFAYACCERVLNLMSDARSRRAVEVVGRFVEGNATTRELDDAHADSQLVWENEWKQAKLDPAIAAYFASMREAGMVSHDGSAVADAEAAWTVASSTATQAAKAAARSASYFAERSAQSHLIRDIFANPFRPTTINPAWLTKSVVALAQTIYDERSFDRLPALADALIDAGCNNQDILDHCRSKGLHVRGCWVVDLVLGKE